MVQRLKYAIHDFTRRQLVWFRRDTRIVWIEGGAQMEDVAIRAADEFLHKH